MRCDAMERKLSHATPGPSTSARRAAQAHLISSSCFCPAYNVSTKSKPTVACSTQDDRKPRDCEVNYELGKLLEAQPWAAVDADTVAAAAAATLEMPAPLTQQAKRSPTENRA